MFFLVNFFEPFLSPKDIARAVTAAKGSRAFAHYSFKEDKAFTIFCLHVAFIDESFDRLENLVNRAVVRSHSVHEGAALEFSVDVKRCVDFSLSPHANSIACFKRSGISNGDPVWWRGQVCP